MLTKCQYHFMCVVFLPSQDLSSYHYSYDRDTYCTHTTARIIELKAPILTKCRVPNMRASTLRENFAVCPSCMWNWCIYPLISHMLIKFFCVQAMEQGMSEVCCSMRIRKILIQGVRVWSPTRSITTFYWLASRMRRQGAPNSSLPRYVSLLKCFVML